ncbi:MAG: GAF domain-containing protein [Deltaproteobacteria bacterium]|nr:GAF domain-containing protein [Deltaproteobacteria bacterium]
MAARNSKKPDVEYLLAENKRLGQELDLFRTLSGRDGPGGQVDQLLDLFLQKAMKVFRTNAGTVFSVDRESNELVFRVVRGRARHRLKGRRMPIGEGIAGRVAKTGKSRLVRNARKDPHWWRRISDYIAYPTKDILAVPLHGRKGDLVGVLELLNKDDHRGFSKEDLAHLTRLAGTVGALLENILLWEESRRMSHRLQVLNEVSHLVNSSLDVRQVHRRAIRAATELVACEAGSLLLVEQDSGELFFEVALGAQARKVRRVRLKPGEGVAGWVVQHGEPVIIQDVSRDKRWSARADQSSDFETRDMICVPVQARGLVIGVLQAINKMRGHFDSDDLHLLQSLADRVAVALENARLFEQTQRTLMETSEALAESIEVRDAYTGGHTRRVVEYSLAIADNMKLAQSDQKQLELAATLHDIGKIGVDDQVLRKPGALDDEEYGMMKRHPVMGCEILAHISYFSAALPGIRNHHERHDGRGYPDGLRAEEIPPIARIIAVADTYDAMTSDRPYRKGLDSRFALQEIRFCSGSQFDPDVVIAFVKAFREGDITGKAEHIPRKPTRRPQLQPRPGKRSKR